MANDILTTLHPDQNPDINLYPNIKKENIPNGVIDRNKLDSGVNSLLNSINELKPSGVDTSAHILAFTTNKGIYIGTDTGHWYYWDGSQYVDGGDYQATQIADNSITLNLLNDDVIDTIEKFTGNKKFIDFENKFITTNVGLGNVVDVNTLVGDNTWCHIIVECNEGDEFLITGSGGTGPRVATFTDSTYHALFISSGDMNNTKIVAPSNTSYLIFNSRKSVDYQVIKNLPLVDFVSNVNDDLDTTILEIDNNFRLLKEAKWQRGRVANGVFNPDVIYEISTTNILLFNKEITLKIADGYEINLNYYDENGNFTSQQSGTSRGEIKLDHTNFFKITLRKKMEH